MNTITYVQKPDGSFFSIEELNALFTSIATVLNNKIDRRGTVMQADLKLIGSILNVPVPEASGDIVGVVG